MHPLSESWFALPLLLAAASATSQVDWRQLAPAVSPRPRLGPVMVFDPGRSVVVLYGGVNSPSSTLTGTWEWDGLQWTVRTGSNPNAQYTHAMAADPVGGGVILASTHGGFPGTWRWNGVAWARLAVTGTPFRWGAAMAADPTRGRVVLFGGMDPATGAVMADTWEWNGSTWSRRSPAVSPPARRGHQMTFDPSRDRVVMTGGFFDNNTPFDDTWEWDGTNWSVRSVNGAGGPLGGLVYDTARDRLVRHDSTLTREWIGGAWVVRSTSTRPTTVEFGMAHDPVRRQTVLLGGQGSGGALFADTWVYEPINPATVTAFGSGCPGSAGTPSLEAAGGPSNLPWIASSLALELRNLQSGALTILAVGLSNTTWGTTALPASLAGFGLPGCDLRVRPDVLLFGTADPMGLGSWMLAMPASSVFVGQRLYLQGGAGDGSANPAGFVVSNGLEARLGAR